MASGGPAAGAGFSESAPRVCAMDESAKTAARMQAREEFVHKCAGAFIGGSIKKTGAMTLDCEYMSSFKYKKQKSPFLTKSYKWP
ncbi:MAG TPA: hypothetical protein VG733_18280 [Chthoniobacteraceae bacterium]|nr:hypothetical protein [Chthoniobacteraceae bacterium]